MAATFFANDGLSALITHIAHLSLDSIDGILSTRAAPSGSSLSDEGLAFALFVEEAEGLLHVARNHALGGVPVSDSLRELLQVEQMARHDRAMAIALSEGREPPPHTPSGRHVVHSNDHDSIRYHRRQGIYVPHSEFSRSSTSDRRERSAISMASLFPPHERYPRPPHSPMGSRSPPSQTNNVSLRTVSLPPPPTFSCTICGDTIEGPIIRTDCDHFLDMGCLQIMFENATRDESLFPPKCCHNEIKLEDIRHYLDFPLVRRFQHKSREFLTKDRVYCHNQHCSSFLGAATATPTSLSCEDCGAKTCARCKEEGHGHRSCTKGLTDAVLELAKGKGWQRCPSCHHLVDRTEGCNHMTCLCKEQFCYVCAAPWKTCTCPQFIDVPDFEEDDLEPVRPVRRLEVDMVEDELEPMPWLERTLRAPRPRTPLRIFLGARTRM